MMPTEEDIAMYLYQIRGDPVTVTILAGEFNLPQAAATRIMYHLIGHGVVRGYYFIRHHCDGFSSKVVDKRRFLSGYAISPWTCPSCQGYVEDGGVDFEMGGIVPEAFDPRGKLFGGSNLTV